MGSGPRGAAICIANSAQSGSKPCHPYLSKQTSIGNSPLDLNNFWLRGFVLTWLPALMLPTLKAMDWEVVGKGTLLGLSVAAPLGPIGWLCVQRTLTQGFAAGIAAGLGTACADVLYAVMASGAWQGISNVLVQQDWLRPAGGVWLIYLGLTSFMNKGQTRPTGNANGLLGTAVGTFVLTLTNPMTLVTFMALLATVNASAGPAFVLGIFLGSMTWWVFLSAVVYRLRHRLPLRWVNPAAAVLLVMMGLWLLRT